MLWACTGRPGKLCGPIQCYGEGSASIIPCGCKLNDEIPIYQLGQLRLMWRGICGEKCVLSPYSYQSTLVMLLLTFLGRRLQSESCLPAAILWWWSLKGSHWFSLLNLNWGIRTWRIKLNLRKKNVKVRSFKTHNPSLELCLDTNSSH